MNPQITRMDADGSKDRDQQTYAIIGAAINLGLLINLGAKSLQYKRFVHNLRESAASADKGMDILFFTQAEFLKYQSIHQSLTSTISREGLVLYG